MDIKSLYGSFIVGYDFSSEVDDGVLVVGVQKNGQVNIVNAFSGTEATELYRKISGGKTI